MTDRHKEFAEAMRNIMRHNEEKEKKQRNVDNDFDEEDCSLQEILEAKFDELFGTKFIIKFEDAKKKRCYWYVR